MFIDGLSRVLRQVGVIGKPEVCKRALVAALLRFAEPQGIVRIDGVDVADIGTQDLRERIALVSQVRPPWQQCSITSHVITHVCCRCVF